MPRYPSAAVAVLLLYASAGACAGAEPPKPAGVQLGREFEELLARPDASIDLAAGALLIAKEQYPDLVLETYLKQLDDLGAKLADELANAPTVKARLDALRKIVFEQEKFGLPKKDDAAAFLLSDVLKNRRGNCLGLSVLCLAIAERAGLKLFGVPVPSRLSGPGHLLVRYDDGTNRVNFDPTEQGATHPDDYYKELFKLAGADLKDGYILGNASRRDVLNLILVNLGGARVEDGRAADALALLERAVNLKPNYAPALNNLGAARLECGDVAGAQAAYRDALKADSRTVGARLGLAAVALRQDKPDEAELEVMEALTVEPGNMQAKSLQANIHLARREFRAAKALLDEIAQAAPKDVRARCNIGTALLAAGDSASAEAAFREAIAIDPAHADAHFGLGEALRAVGRGDEARAAYAEALKLDADHVPTRLAQAQVAKQTGRLKDAELAYRSVLKAQPTNFDAMLGLVDVLTQQKSYVDAERVLTDAVKAHPNHPTVALMGGESKLRTGDFKGALEILERALPRAPAEQKLLFQQRIAVCHGKLKNHAKALALAEEIMKELPSDLVALRVAATASENLRQTAKAVEYYKKVLALTPDDASVKQALARLGVR